MKKGDKLREIGYFLEIKDVRNKHWIYPIACRSLREAVEEATLCVQDMATYLKVYRDSKAQQGVYIGTFLSIPSKGKSAKQLIVQITPYELLTDEEIAKAIDDLERMSRNEPKPRTRR